MGRHTMLRIGVALGLVGLLPLLAACATRTGVRTGAPVPTFPPREILYVVDGYGNGAPESGSAQRIVVFQPAGGSQAAYFALPAGLTSRDHGLLYAATASGGQTTVSVVDTRTSATILRFRIPGTYSTAGRGYTTGTVSADGRWLALRDVATPAASTTIAIADTQAGKLRTTIHLDGDFDLDAISADGQTLYLIQNLHDAQHHYYVRAYDVVAAKLLDGIIADKSEWSNPQMQGSALARRMSSDGTVAYTLYSDAQANVAFVHELPMGSGASPFAHCLFLPTGASGDLLRYYTLALSPDGSTLYAANAALGLVSKISLNGSGVYGDQIVSTGRFDTAGTAGTGAAQALYDGAALSPNQQTLYVAGAHGIWAIRTADLSVRAHFLERQAITGVAVSANGQVLYAADPMDGLTLLEASTGHSLGSLRGPARAPWGIAWVAG